MKTDTVATEAVTPGEPKLTFPIELGGRSTAKEYLKRAGIRDVVLRHEGQPNEQTFSSIMEDFAGGGSTGPDTPPMVMAFGDWCDARGVQPTMGLVANYASDMVTRERRRAAAPSRAEIAPDVKQFWVDYGYDESPNIVGLNSLLTLTELYNFAEAYASRVVASQAAEIAQLERKNELLIHSIEQEQVWKSARQTLITVELAKIGVTILDDVSVPPRNERAEAAETLVEELRTLLLNIEAAANSSNPQVYRDAMEAIHKYFEGQRSPKKEAGNGQ